jgi:hypothetical protein
LPSDADPSSVASHDEHRKEATMSTPSSGLRNEAGSQL